MRRFEGRVVFVTGAGSGMGRATALRLADEGADLFCTDVDAEALEATAERTRERGVEVVARVADLSDPQTAQVAVGEALGCFGRLDVLCNGTGDPHGRDLSPGEWSRHLDWSLSGAVVMCRETLPHLLEVHGNIVNMAAASPTGRAWVSSHLASTAGVLALTRRLAIEYGEQGLRVNALCPESMGPSTSTGAPMPDAVAGAVAYLASDDAAHVNGLELRVDGAPL